MNKGLIERWNSVVREKDTIFHLGDFAFKHPLGDDIAGIFHRLRGRKHLVVGNHDEKNRAVLGLPWESVSHLRVIREAGMSAQICHYPLESWSGGHRGRLMLHGHCHGNLKRKLPRRFDVGADVFDVPVRLDDLWARGQLDKFEPTDHHGEGSGEG